MGTLFAFALARRIVGSPRFRQGVQAAFARGSNGSAVERDDGTVEVEGQGPSLRSRMTRALVVFVALSVASWITGLLVARKLTSGDEGSDEFRLASIMGGKEFHSHAAHLKSGTAITSLGGMELDLREATLDPTGASLELRTTMGGIEVRVPQDWVVEVDQETVGGALEVDVPLPEELPDDAPRLHIHAVTRMGGGLITSRKDQA